MQDRLIARFAQEGPERQEEPERQEGREGQEGRVGQSQQHKP